ncbi:MAG TPA: signal peptidase II [Alphaproteobacteria bacterium]|nr:signal peptidase II [Alphaproteobacteria bacterium]
MSNPIPLSRKLLSLCIVLAVIVLDQLSKWAVTELAIRPRLGGEEPIGLINWLMQAPERLGHASIEILPFYNLAMVWNEGVSFGMMKTGHELMPLILAGFSLALSFAFMLWMFATRDKLTALSLALIVGGALGNVIDRMRFGAVIDFMDVHAAGYHWPAFNFADSCIVLGVGVLILSSFFFQKGAS